MRIQFSDHALERMKSRGITKDQNEEFINNPDEKFHNQVGKVVHKIQIDHESQEKSQRLRQQHLQDGHLPFFP